MSRHEDLGSLIGRVGQADRKAFGALFSATSPKLFGLLIRILGNRATAEEALQDVFVRVWRGAARFEATGLSPMAWLLTITRNVGVERVRARRKGNPDEDLPDPAGPEPVSDTVPEARAVEACLGEIDEDRAAAIRGAYLDGLTYDQLAARYDVPQNTMRTWLRRSLMTLRECMG